MGYCSRCFGMCDWVWGRSDALRSEMSDDAERRSILQRCFPHADLALLLILSIGLFTGPLALVDRRDERSARHVRADDGASMRLWDGRWTSADRDKIPEVAALVAPTVLVQGWGCFRLVSASAVPSRWPLANHGSRRVRDALRCGALRARTTKIRSFRLCIRLRSVRCSTRALRARHPLIASGDNRGVAYEWISDS